MVANERDKSTAFQHPCRECITALFDELQFLVFRISHGKNHPPTFGKLRKERLRNRWGSGGNEDGVERSEFRQSKRAITAMYVRVWVAEPSKRGGSGGCQLRPPFNRENFLG